MTVERHVKQSTYFIVRSFMLVVFVTFLLLLGIFVVVQYICCCSIYLWFVNLILICKSLLVYEWCFYMYVFVGL